MEQKKFDAVKTLRRANPATILAWAVKAIRDELKKAQKRNAEYVGKLTDDDVKRNVGKRELNKLEAGKLTIKDLRKAYVAKENESDAKDAEYAIKRLTDAFSRDLPATIRVEVNWKKSRMWGSNPTAEVWADGYTSHGPVGGCGYDKESTATATAFKENIVFDRIVATCAWLDMKESKATGRDEKTYGYRLGYTGFRFEGGVGYSCHDRIIKRAGYRSTGEFHPKMADGYNYEKI